MPCCKTPARCDLGMKAAACCTVDPASGIPGKIAGAGSARRRRPEKARMPRARRGDRGDGILRPGGRRSPLVSAGARRLGPDLPSSPLHPLLIVTPPEL